MGILAEPAAMVESLRLPPKFSVCELGDQYVTHSTPHRLASEWYRELGAKKYVSIDSNGRGTLNFDLNREWRGAQNVFDLVTDFGTTEHIFNQFEVWRTIHRLAKVGGFIAFDKPTAGYPEHGFYLVSECFLRDMAAANAWEVLHFQRAKTVRGELLRGVFRKRLPSKFAPPTQGRYRKSFLTAAADRNPQMQEDQWRQQAL